MKKITPYLILAHVLAITLCVSTALAINEGDLLTQEQLDAINASNLNKNNLQCRIEGVWDRVPIERDIQYIKPFSCLSIEPQENNYLIIRQNATVGYQRSEWRYCMRFYPLFSCQEYIISRLNNTFQDTLDIIRNLIRGYQSDIEYLPEWQP